MTKEEKNEKIAQIMIYAQAVKQAVYDEYGRSVAKYKCGDIIGDGWSNILVGAISYDPAMDDVVYTGVALTAKGKPRADGAQCRIFEAEAKEVTFNKKKS